MKICILGGSGQLGYELRKYLEVHGHHVVPLTSKDLDIVKIDSCYEVLSQIQPDFVIHAAAYTDIDGCERNPDRAFSINSIGTENIAKVVNQLKSKLIYISTDLVFGGDKGSSYNEDDIPDPINVYGQSKYEGELMVQENLEEYYIVRTSTILDIEVRTL